MNNKPIHGAPVAKNVPADMQATPPVACAFKVGDKVTYTNDQGVRFAGKTVIGFTKGVMSWGAFIYYAPSDCWWSPIKSSNLTAA